MKGDRLAGGARSATFGPSANVSQEKWDSIFGPPEKKEAPKNKLHPAIEVLKRKPRFQNSKG